MTNPLYDALFLPHHANDACFLRDDAGQDLSYRGFADLAAQIANVLVAAGLAPGDRVAVQAPKRVETLALYAAVARAGAVYLPLNNGYTTDELRYFIGDAAPKVLVCDGASEAELSGLIGPGASLLTLNPDGTGSLTERAASMPRVFDTVPRMPTDLAALLYTSGTTGRSKGAMLSHANLLSNAEALVSQWRVTDADRLIHALPIFHTHGLFVAINSAALAGAQIRFIDGFKLDRIIEELPRSTLMMGVPTFYTRLLDDPRFDRDLVANMRLFISGSAPLLAETHVQFEARTGHRILERYGMTETNMNSSNPYEGARKAGTVGRPLPGVEIRVVDPKTGKALPEGEIGAIEVRGPNVFQGYWNMPEKTRAEMRDDGFFITGDLGLFDAEGYLSIVGRDKDLIITGGYNVYPKEIEDVLNCVEGVLETAVFGVPDRDFGETVVAAVVAVAGAEVAEPALRAAAEKSLARFKHPKRYLMLPELPRNTMGKVQKNLLRRDHA